MVRCLLAAGTDPWDNFGKISLDIVEVLSDSTGLPYQAWLDFENFSIRTTAKATAKVLRRYAKAVEALPLKEAN